MNDRELIGMMAGFFILMAIWHALVALGDQHRMQSLGGKQSGFNWVPCAYWAGLAVYAGWRAWE